jgi:CDP-diacylglycerol--glycerol-3-phosphate 3-phosphatidyltransferase
MKLSLQEWHVHSQTINLPMLLTLARLILSPLVLPVLLASLLPVNSLIINIFLAGVFIVFSLTDFFDGYLARRYHQETDLGKLLDPLADKLLVYSTLIALVYVKKVFFYWTIIIVGREFFVTGLREIALYHGFSVPVSLIGKIKTAIQMAFLTFVILNPYQALKIQAPVWNNIENFLLIATLVSTALSAVMYYQDFARKWRELPPSSK